MRHAEAPEVSHSNKRQKLLAKTDTKVRIKVHGILHPNVAAVELGLVFAAAGLHVSQVSPVQSQSVVGECVFQVESEQPTVLHELVASGQLTRESRLRLTLAAFEPNDVIMID
jgi:hypothetical protein